MILSNEEKQQLQTQHANQEKREKSSQDSNLQRYIFTLEGLPEIIGKKVAGLVEELNSENINMESLKGYLGQGIPDEAPSIRQFTWKLILGYLPLQKSKWQSAIEKGKNNYEGLIKIFLSPQRFQNYPLLLRKNHPRYTELQADFLLWQQIEKDTSRTHSQFSFFTKQSAQLMIPFFTSARRQKFKMIYGQEEAAYQQFLSDKQKQRKTYRYDYMTRILYIYSKLNPRIQYVQGMNEILAPIFYLVNVSKPADQIEESSCFYMFNSAISDILELHIKDLDKSKNGIYGKLHEVNQMLMVIDPIIWKRMQQLKIDPFFYCFRWVTLLYAQDFELFDTIRIWESIFSAKDRCLYINLFAISIILSKKQTIQENQFTVVLEQLQNIRENLSVYEAISITNQLYKCYFEVDFNEKAERIRRRFKRQAKKQNQKKPHQKQTISKQEEEPLKKQRKKKKEKKQQVASKQKKEQSTLPSVKEKKQDKETKQQTLQQSKQRSKAEKKPNKGFFKKLTHFVDNFLSKS